MLVADHWTIAFFHCFAFGVTLSLLPLMREEISARLLRYVAGTSLVLVGIGCVVSSKQGDPWVPGAVALADLFILCGAGMERLRPQLLYATGLLLFAGTGFSALVALGFSNCCVTTPAVDVMLPYASLLVGGALVGVALTTMLLGHSYLVHANLSFTHLVRMAAFVIAWLFVRALTVTAMFLQFVGMKDLHARWQGSMDSDPLVGLLPIVRILVGLVFPLILGVMAYKCAKIRANQSATGIMYVATGFVIIGELCSFFLMFRTPFPL